MKTTPISLPFPGEHLAATSPVMTPETDEGVRLRLNFWPGRALTAEALELEQQDRESRMVFCGRLVTAGVVITAIGMSARPDCPAER